MPRSGRQKSSTDIYHVMVRGLNKIAVFNQTRERTRILNLIRENYAEYEIEIYAYCIMPNHFHLLIKAGLQSLASFMVKVLTSYAHYYNYKHDRVGYVFQGRYKSQCVESESYYWSCLRYIHMNPVKAMLCPDIFEYHHSSMEEYYRGRSDLLHKEAFVRKECRFVSAKEFAEYHRMSGWEIFADTEEEVLRQQKEVAQQLLSDMQNDTRLAFNEILDYTKTRNAFDDKIMEALKVSKKKAQEIRNIVKKELGTR